MHKRLGPGFAVPGLFVAAIALSLAGCAGRVPPPSMVPAGPAMARIEDLTGDYCYYGLDFNVRSFGRAVDTIPFIDVRHLATPTLVSVRATAERIVFLYTASDGSEKEQVLDLASVKAAWDGASLVVKHSLGPFPLPMPSGFDFAGHSRESRLFKLADGRLVMTDSVQDKGYKQQSGLGSFYTEERTVAVILDPATGACDAEGRPLQPWFEFGADLREPACAAQLEEQITAILVEKGETAEASALAASTTLESFVGGAPSLTFSASPRPGKSYSFKVVKKKTGCALKLYLIVGRRFTHSSFASRPLPDCACND